jgi:osmoprotectant transport system permease protein
MKLIKNRVLLLLVILAVAAASGLAFLTHAPNRLVSGTGISLAAVLNNGGLYKQPLALAATLASVLLLAGAVFMRPGRITYMAVALAATVLLSGLVALASSHAMGLAAIAADPASGLTAGIERTSFGGAFWILAALCWLAANDAIGHLELKPALRLLASAAVITPVLIALATGRLDQLSLLKEYASRQDVFKAALLQHGQIVLASLALSLLIGVPLGIASVRSGRWMNASRPALFAALNIIQTIPSIALFGLLMAPLALLAASVPVLAQWGIKGVGLAPAVIALTLYSLLPIVRSTAAGLSQVPRPVIEAALGMGLTPRQIFWRVEAPLALPVFVAGLRVAIVQTIGMAVVAALIGAGGFGAIMFQGLLGGALDLVLLGVVPVVAMAVTADAVLKAVALTLAHEF